MTPAPSGDHNPMLRTMRRWQIGLARTHCAPSQWRAWARSRATRGARLDRGRVFPGMSLLEGPPGVEILPGRPEHRSSYTTHLHLAVNPVFVSRYRAVPGAPGERVHHPGTAATVHHLWHPAPVTASSYRRDKHPERTDRSAGSMPSVPAAVQQHLARPGTGLARTAAPAIVASPVHRVIDDLVTRVVRSRERIETPLRGATVVRERRDIAGEVVRAMNAVQDTISPDRPAPGLGTTGWPATAGPGAPAPVHLEQLTDQIVNRLDERLTAHRERFGRAF